MVTFGSGGMRSSGRVSRSEFPMRGFQPHPYMNAMPRQDGGFGRDDMTGVSEASLAKELEDYMGPSAKRDRLNTECKGQDYRPVGYQRDYIPGSLDDELEEYFKDGKSSRNTASKTSDRTDRFDSSGKHGSNLDSELEAYFKGGPTAPRAAPDTRSMMNSSMGAPGVGRSGRLESGGAGLVDTLDRELEGYMGPDATKNRLDCDLATYFKKK